MLGSLGGILVTSQPRVRFYDSGGFRLVGRKWQGWQTKEGPISSWYTAILCISPLRIFGGIPAESHQVAQPDRESTTVPPPRIAVQPVSVLNLEKIEHLVKFRGRGGFTGK